MWMYYSGDCGDGGFRTVVGGDAHSLLTLSLFSHSHTFTYYHNDMTNTQPSGHLIGFSP